MRPRPRWSLMFLGAMFVALLFTYPLWRTLFVGQQQTVLFPLASGEQRSVLVGIPERPVAATAYAAMLTVVPVPTESYPPPIPADAQIILEGEFAPVNVVQSATGKVLIYRLTDDSVLMRFENLQVMNAPGLVVFLSSNEAPTSVDELPGAAASEWLAGGLEGTQGDFQFEIPRELSLSPYRSVVIISDPLRLIYSVATLK